ncbi:LD-carboxypeptidase [Acinetobacter sp. WZC-1]|uniref:LD-carboxypeptidase n=1 Tax=Acinetobacter sp. WZC-1 TaxID=3459034 RepID=UPI00403DB491
MKKLKIIILFISGLVFPFSPAFSKDTIYLVSSSSAYNEQSIPGIISAFNQKGFQVSTRYLNQQVSDFGYSNTDQERAKQLVEALTANDVKYLWFVRGGSGVLNLLPELVKNADQIRASNPKVLLGFSDVTGIHYFVNNFIGWKSIHSANAGSRSIVNSGQSTDQPQQNVIQFSAVDGIDEVLSLIRQGAEYQGLLPLNAEATEKSIQGPLGGGNMTLIQTLFSTRFEHSWNDKILLLEDVNVTYKQLDRILHQILYKKDFHPRAIIFGQFYPAETNDGERLIYKEVLHSFARQSHIPVYYYPYFGHGKVNKPFILGGKVAVLCSSDSEYCRLKQSKF